jgi:hypothetical protein
MFRRSPDLIVPIRDRRQHRRILTLKNFGWFVLVCAIAFAGISIHSEMRGLGPSGGRLLQKEIPPVEQKPMEVVREETSAVPEQSHADPTLVEPMTRAQWLQDETAPAAVVSAPDVARFGESRSEVAIVGGSEGVAIVKKERRQPVLSGGFGRR